MGVGGVSEITLHQPMFEGGSATGEWKDHIMSGYPVQGGSGSGTVIDGAIANVRVRRFDLHAPAGIGTRWEATLSGVRYQIDDVQDAPRSLRLKRLFLSSSEKTGDVIEKDAE